MGRPKEPRLSGVEPLDRVVQRHCEQVLAQSNNCVAVACEALGISRRTLIRWRARWRNQQRVRERLAVERGQRQEAA